MSKAPTASIQYVGEAGITQTCVDAVMRYLQFGDRIVEGRVLTHQSAHALLLRTDTELLIAVRSGFASGYPGEGPRGLSRVLFALVNHNVDVIERHVPAKLIERLNRAALTADDVELVLAPPPIVGEGVYKFIDSQHALPGLGPFLRSTFPPVVPFGIVDDRLAEMVLSFWDNPDSCLMIAYRKLEDIIRKRTGIREHGAKLFSQAFFGDSPALIWRDLESGEQKARGQFFVQAYGAFRNPRAHRHTHETDQDLLSELLMVNLLFRLEAQADTPDDSRPDRNT